MDESQERGEAEHVENGRRETLHTQKYSPITVLTVGTEQAVLQRGSSVRARIFSYGEYFKAMEVILLSGKTGTDQDAEKNVTVYPTNSRFKLGRFLNAVRIGKRLPRPDVVSTQDPFETAIVAWLIARAHEAPLHVQVHTDFLSPAYNAHSLKNRIRVLIARFILRQAARVRVVSPRIERSIKKRYGLHAPVSVLPIFADLARFRAATPGPALPARFSGFATVLAFIGRLESEKGAYRALEAFAAVAPPSACLVFVGDGAQREGLTNRAAALGVATRTFFEGTNDPAPYVALADLVLVPSEYEGYGLVIVEALAAGTPVLATDVGIARDAGAIITSKDGFAGALAQWFGGGAREGHLLSYPYASFDEYAEAYCADIAACKVIS